MVKYSYCCILFLVWLCEARAYLPYELDHKVQLTHTSASDRSLPIIHIGRSFHEDQGSLFLRAMIYKRLRASTTSR